VLVAVLGVLIVAVQLMIVQAMYRAKATARVTTSR
jgi:hypothetical protein